MVVVIGGFALAGPSVWHTAMLVQAASEAVDRGLGGLDRVASWFLSASVQPIDWSRLRGSGGSPVAT